MLLKSDVIPQATKTERERNQRKEYQTQMEYRAHLQAFIDRWRYNANRAAQAQMKIKILEKLPELEMPEAEETEKFKFDHIIHGDRTTFTYLTAGDQVPGNREDFSTSITIERSNLRIYA
jgi:ATPase subunit of ABC transporter with duplicated ATPase domains